MATTIKTLEAKIEALHKLKGKIDFEIETFEAKIELLGGKRKMRPIDAFGTHRANLMRALEPGGLLFDGHWVKGTALREKHRAWRTLIEDMNAPGAAGQSTRAKAAAILESLGVHYQRNGRALKFMLL